MTTEFLSRGYPVGWTGRVLLGLWCLFLLGGFSAAAMMTPDPRGYGTHRCLGLPPCTIRSAFEIPCPTCGMTTSFSNFIRGRFLQSVRANVAGFLFAVMCAAQIPWSLVSMYRGRMWGVSRPDFTLLCLLLSLFALSIAQWAWWVFLR